MDRSDQCEQLAKAAKDILQPAKQTMKQKKETAQQKPVPSQPGYVRTPPVRCVEQYMEQALAPLVKAQAAQQQELDAQHQTMVSLHATMQQQCRQR